MNPRNALTIVLLLFVAACIVVLTVKSLRQGPPSGAAGNSAATTAEGSASPAAPARADRLVAYYFHGKVRCPTCRSIEAYAHEAIESGFGEQIKDGRIEWKVVDYEQLENEHFAKEFQLAAPSVVLVEVRGGAQKNSKNLAEVWELVGNKPAFVAFVQKEVRALLDGPVK